MTTVIEETTVYKVIPVPTNEEIFFRSLATIDPELYRIKMALLDTQVNPIAVPSIIRGISNITYGTGFGDVRIHIKAGIVTHVKSEESEELNLPALNQASK